MDQCAVGRNTACQFTYGNRIEFMKLGPHTTYNSSFSSRFLVHPNLLPLYSAHWNRHILVHFNPHYWKQALVYRRHIGETTEVCNWVHHEFLVPIRQDKLEN